MKAITVESNRAYSALYELEYAIQKELHSAKNEDVGCWLKKSLRNLRSANTFLIRANSALVKAARQLTA